MSGSCSGLNRHAGEEPEILRKCDTQEKEEKGKREDDLKDMPVTVIQHEMSEDN